MIPSGTTRLALASALPALLALSLSAPGCASRRQGSLTADDQREHLLFSLPPWCSMGKLGWAEYAKAQAREPTGEGVCGVSLGPSRDDGLCVEVHEGKPSRVVARRSGKELPLAPAPGRPEWGDWSALSAQGGGGGEGAIYYRVAGDRISAGPAQGGTAEGPCFWR